MKHQFRIAILVLISTFLFSACVSKKKKGEVGKVGKFYHNMTSKYNGYFNANELMKTTYMTLDAGHKDNYNQILPVFPYVESTAAKSVSPDLDIVVEKVTRVAIVHEPGDYVDDCYVMMGQAQFLKQDYETAEETFVYFQEEFNPNNPFGKNYQRKKKSKNQRKKEREAEKKERDEERKEAKKIKDEERKAADELKKEEKKRKEAERKAKDEARKKEREQQKKDREAQKKNRKKNRGKKKRPVKKKETPAKKDSTTIKTNSTKPLLPKKIEEIEEKEEVVADQKEKKKEDEPKDKTAYSEGMLWLAKTYIERENYSSADYILKNLDKKNLQDHVRREIAPTLAHLNIRQKKFQSAIPHLEDAIETSNKKHLKARYSYIIGQIYQRDGLREEASRAFARVNKYKPSFDMKFNAKLSALKNAVKDGSRPIASVEDELNDMLGDRKYEEYDYKIHYTLGEIHLDKGDQDLALKDFSMSLRANESDPALKAETYYLLGELYYNQETYVKAKNYYDSTLTVMDKEDIRHSKVTLLAANLTEIANNINTIALQDSLLRLSKLSKEEQAEIAKSIVKAQPKKEELAADNSKDKRGRKKRQSAAEKLMGRDMFGISNKWPYDLKKVEQGKNGFKRKWSEIALEDNWRRASSLNTFYAGNDEDIEGEKEPDNELDEDPISDKEVNEILKSVPKNPNDIANANKEIMKAMYDLGVLYRSKLNNYEKSVEALEALLTRYPDTPHKLDAYYNLYLANLDLSNQAKAKYYLAKITDEFGESTIAKILNDPEYGNKVMNDQQKILAYYDETYALYSKGKFEEVNQRVKVVENSFTFQHNLKPKFALLNAMSLGKINGKEAYIAALSDMVTRHADTPEATRGKEILRFLKGDSEAFEQLDIKEVDDIFNKEDDRRHYVMLVTTVENSEKFTNAKIGISKYNKKYHKLKKLQLNHAFLDQEKNSRIILVRQFKDKGQAVKYYDEILKNKEEFVGEVDIEYDLFSITQANYRKVVAERSVKSYRVFHDTYYKGE